MGTTRIGNNLIKVSERLDKDGNVIETTEGKADPLKAAQEARAKRLGIERS